MKIYLVGGAVRDKLLNIPVHECDYVVVGSTVADMKKLGFKQVGKDFPVFLHPETNEEYALARMERKISPGYQGFIFDVSKEVTLEEDLKRRDLTINAMAETLAGDLIDPYGGKNDLFQGILRHISPAFAEDPVRILRVARFYARYANKGFKIAPETYILMKQMVQNGEVNALVAERVWKELERALTEPDPQKFFEVLHECGALKILFPYLTINGSGLQALIATKGVTNNANIRFAALLHAMPEDKVDVNPEAAILHICNILKVPNSYRELAILTTRHFRAICNGEFKHAESLINFFYAVDIFRRETRFINFLVVCEAIAHSCNQTIDKSFYEDAMKIAKSVDVKGLIAQGLEGYQLAQSLKATRQQAIEEWLHQKMSF